MRDRSLPLRAAFFEEFAFRCQAAAAREGDLVAWLASNLRLPPHSLHLLGVGWSADFNAFTFPMRHELGSICGVRLRRPNGFKFAVHGSQQGLFLPDGQFATGPLFIVEGATDAAAALALGVDVVGRPSASAYGMSRADKWAIESARGRHLVVVADRDETGIASARRVAAAAMRVARSVRLLVPPSDLKDLREWVGQGLRRAELLAAAAGAARAGLAQGRRTG